VLVFLDDILIYSTSLEEQQSISAWFCKCSRKINYFSKLPNALLHNQSWNT